MIKSRRGAGLVLVGLLVGLGACQRAPSPPRAILVVKTLDNVFFASIRDGFVAALPSPEAAIVRAGVNESDVEGQRTILRAFAGSGLSSKNLRGLVISPASSGPELVPELKQFRDAGIPVILVDTAIGVENFKRAGTDYNVLIQSNNVQGGRLAADLLVGKLTAGKTNYSVLMLEGALNSDTGAQRRAGFVERIRQIEVERRLKINLTFRPANWRREEAVRITSALMSRAQPLDAIFAANDEMALGAARSYSSLNRRAPPIVGFDATDEALQATRSGVIAGTIAQDPKAMGRLSAELLQDPKLAQQSFATRDVLVLTCNPDCK